MSIIDNIKAYEILDSRGDPTLLTEVDLENSGRVIANQSKPTHLKLKGKRKLTNRF